MGSADGARDFTLPRSALVVPFVAAISPPSSRSRDCWNSQSGPAGNISCSPGRRAEDCLFGARAAPGNRLELEAENLVAHGVDGLSLRAPCSLCQPEPAGSRHIPWVRCG